MKTTLRLGPAATIAAVAFTVACGAGNKPPATPDPASSATAASGSSGSGSTTATPPAVVSSQPPVPDRPPVASAEPAVSSDPMASLAPDDINKQSPLKPAFFKYDSDQLDDEARQALTDDAAMLKKYPQWVVTIEGHSDERGTAEYNLALGERRALAARTFLLSLGLPAAQLHTVSFGKEYPFDPAHTESAWHTNRRAHLMVTSSK